MGAASDDHDDLAAPQDANPDANQDAPTAATPGSSTGADTVEDLDDDTDEDLDAASGAPVPFDLGDGDVATRVAHARQRHGLAGGMLAAGMLGIDQVVNGRKPREDAPIVIAANSDPIDIDRDGISVPLDPDDPDGQFAVAAPPLPRTEPITAPRGAARRRWR